MNDSQKIWIVFLAHLYYKIEVKTKFHLSGSGNIDFLKPILEMWYKFGPRMISAWEKGARYVDSNSDYLLRLDYNSYMENDLFIKVFGLEIQRLYNRAIYFDMSKINYRVENGKLLYFGGGDTNFQYINDCLEPFTASFVDETRKKRFEEGFDKDFLLFFKDYIGIDFSKANNFFEVYLPSKLNSEKS